MISAPRSRVHGSKAATPLSPEWVPNHALDEGVDGQNASWRLCGLQRNACPGCGLNDPPAQRPRLNAAPEVLKAMRQPAAVRHRQPEAEQQPLLVAGAVVLIRRAAVEDYVVVQQLDITGDERRVKAHVLRHFGQQVERLVLRGGDPWHFRELLRLLDIGAGVLEVPRITAAQN